MRKIHETLPLFPMLLPSVPFKERHKLPHVKAVYFALTSDSNVLYIGATQDLYRRMKYHNYIKRLEDSGCSSIALYVCDIMLLAEVEEAMISQFQPPLNS
jgi:excinuclease UvrABC nuclease subunit